MVLYDQTGVLAEEYMKRLSVSEKRVVLHSVRMTDEGSFTVKDSEGKVKIRTCLNVRGKARSELYSILSALIDHSAIKCVMLCVCRCASDFLSVSGSFLCILLKFYHNGKLLFIFPELICTACIIFSAWPTCSDSVPPDWGLPHRLRATAVS